MTENKNPAWLFDILMACFFGYWAALNANDLLNWWQAIIMIITDFLAATLISFIYAYILRHWKP